jgi:hypothetical protein
MLVTEIYNGQGLGNQLFCYVTTRCIALDRGLLYGVMGREKFKASSFIELDYGQPVIGGFTPIEGQEPLVLPDGITNYYVEKGKLHENGSEVRSYDKDLLNVPDNTKIDGLLQGEGYFGHRKEEIREWLKVESVPMPEKTCVINFRGGEYKYVPEFFLSKKYWDDGIRVMREQGVTEFIVVTDDVEEARKFFPDFKITHNMKDDWVAIQSAYYLLLSNSTFAWFPAWLNKVVKLVIAPKYFGRHNISDGYWSLETNLTKGWMWMDRNGVLFSYDECLKELQ